MGNEELVDMLCDEIREKLSLSLGLRDRLVWRLSHRDDGDWEPALATGGSEGGAGRWLFKEHQEISGNCSLL